MITFKDILSEEIKQDYMELYHGTSARRANKIAKDGFRIRAVKNKTMGGDPDGHRDYIWFAKKKEWAKNYAEMHLYPTIITVQIPISYFNSIKGRNDGPDSVWIPAKDLSLIRIVKIERCRNAINE